MDFKHFLTRADIALWFSKSFGLNIECILVRESDNKVSESPSEEEKIQIEEILYLLDKFCVGDSFYHELTMVSDGLPWSYLIQQCRTE